MLAAVLGVAALAFLSGTTLQGCWKEQEPPPPPPRQVGSLAFLYTPGTLEEERRCAEYLGRAAPGGISAHAAAVLEADSAKLFGELTQVTEWSELNDRFMCELPRALDRAFDVYRKTVRVEGGETLEQALSGLTREGFLLEKAWNNTAVGKATQHMERYGHEPGYYGGTLCYLLHFDRGGFCGLARMKTPEMAGFMAHFPDLFVHPYMDALNQSCGRTLMRSCLNRAFYVNPVPKEGAARRAKRHLGMQPALAPDPAQPSLSSSGDASTPAALGEVSEHSCAPEGDAFPTLEDTLTNLSAQLSAGHLADKLVPMREAVAAVAHAGGDGKRNRTDKVFQHAITLGILATQVAKEIGPLIVTQVGNAFVPGLGIMILLLQSLQVAPSDAKVDSTDRNAELAAMISNAVSRAIDQNRRGDIARRSRVFHDMFKNRMQALTHTPTQATWDWAMRSYWVTQCVVIDDDITYLMAHIVAAGEKLQASHSDLVQEGVHLMLFHLSTWLRALLFQYLQFGRVYFTSGLQVLLAEGKTRCGGSLGPCAEHLLAAAESQYRSCKKALATCDADLEFMGLQMRLDFRDHSARWSKWQLQLLGSLIPLLKGFEFFAEERALIDEWQLLVASEAGFFGMPSPIPAFKTAPRQQQRALLTMSCTTSAETQFHHTTVLRIGKRSRAPRQDPEGAHGVVVKAAPDKPTADWDGSLRTFRELRHFGRNRVHGEDDEEVVGEHLQLLEAGNASSVGPAWVGSFSGRPNFQWAPSVEGGFFIAFLKTHTVTELQKFCRSEKEEQKPAHTICATKEIEDTVKFLVPRRDGGVLAVTKATIWLFTPDLVYAQSPYMHGDVEWAAPDTTGGVWVSKRMHFRHVRGWADLVRYDDDLRAVVELRGWSGIRALVPCADGGVLVWINKGGGRFQLNKIGALGNIESHSDGWRHLEHVAPLADGSFMTVSSSGEVGLLEKDISKYTPVLTRSFKSANKLLEQCGGQTRKTLVPLDWPAAAPDASGTANLMPWTPYGRLGE